MYSQREMDQFPTQRQSRPPISLVAQDFLSSQKTTLSTMNVLLEMLVQELASGNAVVHRFLITFHHIIIHVQGKENQSKTIKYIDLEK